MGNPLDQDGRVSFIFESRSVTTKIKVRWIVSLVSLGRLLLITVSKEEPIVKIG